MAQKSQIEFHCRLHPERWTAVLGQAHLNLAKVLPVAPVQAEAALAAPAHLRPGPLQSSRLEPVCYLQARQLPQVGQKVWGLPANLDWVGCLHLAIAVSPRSSATRRKLQMRPPLSSAQSDASLSQPPAGGAAPG